MALRNRTQHMGRRASAAAQETFGTLRDSAGEYYGQGREAVGDLAHSFEESLREHPVRWLLLGIGIGCLVSAALLDR